MKIYDKVCAVCGRSFQSNKQWTKLCSRECNCKLRQACAKTRKKPETLADFKKEIVKIKITEKIDVFDHMQPKVGTVYTAEKNMGGEQCIYIIRNIGRLGLVIRPEECTEVV